MLVKPLSMLVKPLSMLVKPLSMLVKPLSMSLDKYHEAVSHVIATLSFTRAIIDIIAVDMDAYADRS
jgi:hypothetical protein